MYITQSLQDLILFIRLVVVIY